MKKSFLYLLLLVLFSCDSEDEGSFIASYKDNNLTLEEVLFNKPLLVDSATFVNKEINRWIKNQVILDKAKLYIDENDKELQLKVKKYKELLIINKYQTDLLNNEFDTTILKSDVEEYYKNHPEDFILHKNIVKVRFVKVNNENLNLKKIESLVVTKDDLEMKELSKFCEMYAENSFLNDSVWKYFSYFDQKIIISDKERKKIFSKKNKLYRFTDDHFVSFFFIKDYQIKGKESPLPFVFTKIREILRNKNKQKFLNEIENKLYNEALSSEHVKIL